MYLACCISWSDFGNPWGPILCCILSIDFILAGGPHLAIREALFIAALFRDIIFILVPSYPIHF